MCVCEVVAIVQLTEQLAGNLRTARLCEVAEITDRGKVNLPSTDSFVHAPSGLFKPDPAGLLHCAQAVVDIEERGSCNNNLLLCLLLLHSWVRC